MLSPWKVEMGEEEDFPPKFKEGNWKYVDTQWLMSGCHGIDGIILLCCFVYILLNCTFPVERKVSTVVKRLPRLNPGSSLVVRS